MYINVDGKCSITDTDKIDQLIKERKAVQGNIIYCKSTDNSFFFKNEFYETEEELMLAVAKYSLEGFEVYYHADNRSNKARNTKRKR